MRRLGTAVAAVAAVGCAALGQGAPAVEVRKAAAAVQVRLTTDVPDPYWVMSGPSETYRSIRVNGRLRDLLEGYARAKSGPADGSVVTALVHLERVDTTYGQVGSVRTRGTRLALGPRRILTDASPAWGGDTHALEGWKPYQITKTVEVRLTAEVSIDGRSLAKDPIAIRLVEVTDRDDIDRWTYDYVPLVDRALREAVARVDEVVERALSLRKP